MSAIDVLRGGAWRCRSCDEEHHGIFHLVADAPWHWGDAGDREPNSALRMDGDFLSWDLCVIGGRDYFIRGILEIPVHGMEGRFAFGCWSTLSRANFELYSNHLDGIEVDEPWTGWFSCEFRSFPGTVNTPCWVMPHSDGALPCIWLDDQSHPLAIAQRDGIDAERLLEIYRVHGHPLD